MWKSDCIGCMHEVYLHYAWACVFWESELVSKNIHTGHKQKAFCHCVLVCAFWDGDALWYNTRNGHMQKACCHCALSFVFWGSRLLQKNSCKGHTHEARLLSLWFRMCRLSSKDVLKVWLHWVQLKGLSPEWINMCFLRSPTCLLEYSHRVQLRAQHVCLQGGSTHSWVAILVTTVGLHCLNCKAFNFFALWHFGNLI